MEIDDHSIWLKHEVRTGACLLNSICLIIFLIFHSLRMYYSQRDAKKTKLCKIFNIKYLSFMVIIFSLLSQINQAILYVPTQFKWIVADPPGPWITHDTCLFTVTFGIYCIIASKLALYVFSYIPIVYHIFV